MLKNKKIVFLGDSITESCGASEKSKGFAYRFKEKTGAIVTELGIGGTRIAYKFIPTLENLLFDKFYETRISEIPQDAEVIVVFGGTNDYGHGDAPLGKMGDDTIFTFYGAVYQLIKKIRYAFPNAQLIFATPLHRQAEHERGLNLIDFVNAIKEVCKKESVPVIDLYNLFEVNPEKDEDRIKYAPDGLHPNDLGHDLLSDAFIKYLEPIIK